jgi:3-phosphoglycerate kinase
MPNITFIDDVEIINKRVLIRNDFNVSLNQSHKIANDQRIRQAIPTISYLLKNQNKLILTSHLGEPKGYDSSLSLRVIQEDLERFLPDYTIILFPTIQTLKEALPKQTVREIFLLENLRFLPGEQKNDAHLAQSLASLADIYVNDAFSVSHREAASIVTLPHLLPSFGGFLLKQEIHALAPLLEHPQSPYVVVLGGAKISTKLPLLIKLAQICDTILVGGAMANTFLVAKGLPVGKSLIEANEIDHARTLIHLSRSKADIVLPIDVSVGDSTEATVLTTKSVEAVSESDMILDIGPRTQALFSKIIDEAQTILWNGPLGYTENPVFKTGTDAVYEAIIANPHCISIVGGGDTITALAHENHIQKITHISTAGGGMLEYLEKGTLPGLEALKRSSRIG